jgi:hypothetical protein
LFFSRLGILQNESRRPVKLARCRICGNIHVFRPQMPDLPPGAGPPRTIAPTAMIGAMIERRII